MPDITEFWPSQKNIDDCIKTRMEGVSSDSLLFAVHQPISLEFELSISMKIQTKTEEDLLDDFLKEPGEGAGCMAVEGTTGIGKTHIIRWLEAKLRQEKQSKDKFVLIRIEKGSSLNEVMRTILKPFLEDANFKSIWDDLENVITIPDAGSAAVILGAALENTLKDEVKRLNKLKADTGTLTPEQRSELSHAQRLHLILTGEHIKDHVRKNTLERIVQQQVSGKKEAQFDDDHDYEQFEATDFDFSNIDFEKIGPETGNYISLLEKDDGKEKKTACNVINKVADAAIADAFNLRKNIGGKSWGDLFKDLRKNLKKVGKELVFLVEDYFCLTGIQETLNEILMQVNIDENRKPTYCNIRSIIGNTPGYKPIPDSYIGRGGGKYRIIQTFDDSETIYQKTIDLVGSYVNAARWGVKNLENRSEDRPNFYEKSEISKKDQDALELFGKTSQSLHLYPFNENCIRRLVDVKLTQSGTLQFIPRHIIQWVIKPLLEQEDRFKNGGFPDQSLDVGTSSIIEEYIDQQTLTKPDKRRWQVFLSLWGDNPKTGDEISELGKNEISKIFQLPPLGSATIIDPNGDEKRKKKEEEKGKEEGKGKEKGEGEGENIWSGAIEHWGKNETRLGQTPANILRQGIAKLLTDRIKWHTLRITKREIDSNLISIPNAAGGAPGQVQGQKPISIYPDYKNSGGATATRQNELLSVIRWYETDPNLKENNWNYQGGNLDQLRAFNLIDRLVPKFEEHLLKVATGELQALIPLAKNMATLRGHYVEEDSQIHKIFATPPEDGASPPGFPQARDVPTAYQQISELEKGVNNLSLAMSNLIYDRCACYQGDTGKTHYAVDFARLLHRVDPVELGHIRDLEANHDLKIFARDLKDNALKSKANKFIQTAEKDLDVVHKTFKVLALSNDGDDYFQKLMDATMSATTIWPTEFNRDDIREAYEVMKNSPLTKKSLQEIGAVVRNDTENLVKLSKILDRVKPPEIVELHSNSLKINSFLNELYKNISNHTAATGAGGLSGAQSSITKLLGELSHSLDKVVGA